MIGAYHPFFHDELIRRIEARRQDRLGGMARGDCMTFDEYTRGVGYFEGLDDALEIADEIKKEHDRA